MTTPTTPTGKPPVVDFETWNAQMRDQGALEDELFEHQLKVAASRRHRPMTPVKGDYTFVGAEGECSFIDLFAGQRQLAVYHFMFSPEWDKGCPHCTEYAQAQGAGINKELLARDGRYILISRAPYEKLSAWATEKGITTPWYSAPTEFSEEMEFINDSFGDYPGISVFFRDTDDTVYRTYRSSNSVVETTMPASGLLRMLPWGMQERGEDSPEGFPQRFDPM